MKKIELYKGQCEWVENIEKTLGISSSAIFTIKLKFKGQNYKGTYEAIYGGRDFTHLFFFYHSKSLNKTCELAVSPIDICCESVVLMKNGNKIPKADLISLNMRPSKNLNVGYSYVIKSNLFAKKVRHCIYSSYDEQGYNFLFYNADTSHIACFKIGYDDIDNYEVYDLEDDVPAQVDLKEQNCLNENSNSKVKYYIRNVDPSIPIEEYGKELSQFNFHALTENEKSLIPSNYRCYADYMIELETAEDFRKLVEEVERIIIEEPKTSETGRIIKNENGDEYRTIIIYDDYVE